MINKTYKCPICGKIYENAKDLSECVKKCGEEVSKNMEKIDILEKKINKSYEELKELIAEYNSLSKDRKISSSLRTNDNILRTNDNINSDNELENLLERVFNVKQCSVCEKNDCKNGNCEKKSGKNNINLKKVSTPKFERDFCDSILEFLKEL